MIGNVLSAAVNIILNIILIPKYGIIGAALATCFGFAIYLGFIFFKFKKHGEK